MNYINIQEYAITFLASFMDNKYPYHMENNEKLDRYTHMHAHTNTEENMYFSMMSMIN